MRPTRDHAQEVVPEDAKQESSAPRESVTEQAKDETELAPRELEERVAPTLGWGANHNETLLADR